jgi:pyruvate,water dikinase
MLKWFSDIKDDEILLVGGKGLNLSKMYRNGLDVPNGFVLLSTAYDQYIEENQLMELFDDIFESKYCTLEISQKIQQLFSINNLSKKLVEDIMSEFKKIPGGKVAIRSSSTVEDLPGMSFAGQYSTYLNVDKEELIIKIVECWKSHWNKRAIDYRKANKITGYFSHGVVIQEMIDAKVSGVAFTVDPLTGIRNHILINSSYGLGESTVSGEVNPDISIVDKSEMKIISQQISDKKIQYIYSDKGIEKVQIPVSIQKKPSLSEKNIERLAVLAEKVEDFFSKPQDIEFACDEKGKIYLLQSRDITTLFPIDELEFDGKLRGYLSASTVLLGMKEPFTPLGFDIMSHMFPTIINIMTSRKNPLDNRFVKYAGHRMYIDMTYLMASGFASKQFANIFSGNDLPLKGVMYKVIKDYGNTFRKQGIHFRLPLGLVKYGFKIGLKTMKILKIPNDKRYDAIIAIGDDLYSEIMKTFKSLKTPEEKLDFSTYSLVEAFKLSQSQAMYCLDANNIGKIEKTLKKHFNDKYVPELLVQSLPRCFTQTMTVKLNNYAKYLDEYGLEPSVNHPIFKEIIKTYGHRGNTELDIGTKRWKEDPSYLIGLVKTYMEDKMYVRNLEDHEAKRQQALRMIDNIYEDMKNIRGEKKAEKFKKSLINYRIGAGMREYPKSDIVRFMELGRKALMELGLELCDKGWIEDQNDIFFLHKKDIYTALSSNNKNNIKKQISLNKSSYEKEMTRNRIPRMILNNGATYYSSTTVAKDSNSLKGMPLSPGVHTGRIRIVTDPTDTDLVEGEVMVTESTNPAWTPLFATAGALIMEYGGPISHGGIVAREYGIPAVVGISADTSQLKDGQLVKVDGEVGTVEIIES